MNSNPNQKPRFDFVQSRKAFFMLSGVITILGVLTLAIFGLNYGVDFKSGTTLDVAFVEAADVKKSDLEPILENHKTTISIGEERVNIRFEKVLEEEQRLRILQTFEEQYGEISVEESTVDAGMAKELGVKAISVVLIASLFIIIYVSIRFEWRFALAAIVALFHDAFIVISLFSILRFEVNLTFIAAVLTIIGYSINDTIVIFDRIRENLRTAKIKSFDDLATLVNTSIWQTLARSINTALTVIIAALFLFLFGSPSIQLFSLAMLIGLISGGYSSIFIASQIWLLLKKSSIGKKKTVSTS
ncbi:protein translocase subunit SecF [Marinicrinis sediminis]|uniref:Protein-export membrane protein SecF n=1 Tax=Marinicrinis sediminis TaxID=1652465 RepID=A0ABW5R5Z4_9BACL